MTMISSPAATVPADPSPRQLIWIKAKRHPALLLGMLLFASRRIGVR